MLEEEIGQVIHYCSICVSSNVFKLGISLDRVYFYCSSNVHHGKGITVRVSILPP